MRDPFPIGANPRALDPPSLGEAGSGLRMPSSHSPRMPILPDARAAPRRRSAVPDTAPPGHDEYDGHRVLRGVALAALLCAAFWLLVTGRIAGWW